MSILKYKLKTSRSLLVLVPFFFFTCSSDLFFSLVLLTCCSHFSLVLMANSSDFLLVLLKFKPEKLRLKAPLYQTYFWFHVNNNNDVNFVFTTLLSEALNMILSSESPDSEDLNDQR